MVNVQNDVYIGVPAIVNKNGIRELLKLDLNEKEQEQLNKSCKLIKQMREEGLENIILE